MFELVLDLIDLVFQLANPDMEPSEVIKEVKPVDTAFLSKVRGKGRK